MKLQAFMLLQFFFFPYVVAAFLLPEPSAAASLPTHGLLPGAADRQ
uniref:Uncharacterized protein n=1 Tax=Oryza brachyantha TaxID=4533 RepID=J3NB49_ORYBR